MLNNNLADISVFENLQYQANRSMGFLSQMSVFNSPSDVVEMKKAADALIAVFDKGIRIYQKQEQLKQDLEKLKKEWETITPKMDLVVKTYESTKKDINRKRENELQSIGKMEKSQREKSSKIFTKEAMVLSEIEQKVETKRNML
jgi:hypothetical protein